MNRRSDYERPAAPRPAGSSRETLVRHVDGDAEIVIDTRHVPLLITTWFGSPTLKLAETYATWLDGFFERCRVAGRRVVILDDAVRAGRPVPPVRGRLSQIKCSADVVIDRVVVVDSASIRGAITALSWITGVAIKTTPVIDDGVRNCLALLDEAKIPHPREFAFEPAQPSRRA